MQNITLNKNLNFFIQALIFLTPIGAIVIRGWVNLFMFILLFISIYIWAKQKKEFIGEVNKTEKYMFSFFIFYFLILIVAILVHLENPDIGRNIEAGLRFILIIPIYLLFKKISKIEKLLVYGMILSIVTAFLYSVYDLYILGLPNAVGQYFEIIVGNETAMFMLVLLVAIPQIIKNKKIQYPIIILIVILSLWVVYAADNRSGFLVVLVGFSLFFILKFKPIISFLTIAFLMLSSIIAYNNVTTIKTSAGEAINNTIEYFQSKNINDEVRLTSAGIRFEMWRTTPYFLTDSIIIGSGLSSYERISRQLVDKKIINKEVSHHSRPHNLFIENLMFKGILGLISILLVVFYPLWIFIRDYKLAKQTAMMGILLQTSVIVQSLTESVIYRGAYVISYFFVLSIILIWHQRAIKTNAKK
ncbi:MAG: hypothetical protein DRQ51_04585 [Gammaproteobacteria bacterium]|nr:MAG: hypothetical protein DRQ51_04585 [Gammaproteobacteria bacterium]